MIRLLSLAAVGLALALPLTAQWYVTGSAAAQRFVYRTQPIHPLCLRELSPAPVLITECTTPGVPVEVRPDAPGWLRASLPGSQLGYRVLANARDRFLVATERLGGGSAHVNAVDWLRLDSARLAHVSNIKGLPCGGVTGEASDSLVEIEKAGSSIDLLSRAGVVFSRADSSRMRVLSRPTASFGCSGVRYRFHSALDRFDLTGARLGDIDAKAIDTVGSATPGANPQGCFDLLALQRINAGKRELSIADMMDLGRTFAGRCLAPAPNAIPVRSTTSQTPPESGVPRAAGRAPVDAGEHDPLATLARGKIASAEVTWADTSLFHGDSRIAAALVRALLERPNGSTSYIQFWSNLLGVPSLAANITHVNGNPGRLLVWSSGASAMLFVYLDDNGRWWFGHWPQAPLWDVDPRAPCCG